MNVPYIQRSGLTGLCKRTPVFLMSLDKVKYCAEYTDMYTPHSTYMVHVPVYVGIQIPMYTEMLYIQHKSRLMCFIAALLATRKMLFHKPAADDQTQFCLLTK